MAGKVIQLQHRVKLRIRRLRRETRSAGVATRCQIILLANKGRASRAIGEAVSCHRSWASRVIAAFKECGEAALMDGREDNGQEKLGEEYLSKLQRVVRGRPTDFGYPRPTWTQELLIRVMCEQVGVTISRSTMSRALRRNGARRSRPRPRVGCPWPKAAKEARLQAIERVVRACPAGEVVVYEDEVDIHLNPKIGLDWMNCGQQKTVMTPGKNEKRYLAGAKNAHTGRLTCVERPMKNSWLFLALLAALGEDYPRARRIHVILDNYRIHSSKIVQQALKGYEERIVLHFLPPYCPDHNKIERDWQDLHANVTRNHQCGKMEELMINVWCWIEYRNGRHATKIRRAA
jgi:transposase